MPTRFAILLALAGCGRLGFGENDAAVADASVVPPDAVAVPRLCNPHAITVLPFVSEVPTAVRAVPLSRGHAVAVETDQTKIHVVRVDATGTLVSTHLPFAGGYTIFGMAQLADRPFVYLKTAGTGYIKMLVPDWNSYMTGPSSEPFPVDPIQATLPGGVTAMIGQINNASMTLRAIDRDGGDAGVVVDYAPAAVAGALASTPGGVRVVVDVGDGTCETFAITPRGVTGGKHRFGPCTRPLVAAHDDTTGTIVYQPTAGTYAVHTIPADTAAAGETLSLGPLLGARVATINGESWIASVDNRGVRLSRIVHGALVTELVPGISGPFDLTTEGMFWVTGDTLSGGVPCLQ